MYVSELGRKGAKEGRTKGAKDEEKEEGRKGGKE